MHTKRQVGKSAAEDLGGRTDPLDGEHVQAKTAAKFQPANQTRPTTPMSDKHYDIAIIGGGPAGTSAALVLATSGRRVLMLEKLHHPRPKPCGGGLTAKSLGILKKLGVEPGGQFIDTMEFNHYPIHRNRFRRPRGLFQTVCRSEFDNRLFRLAQERGVEAIEGIRITELSHPYDRFQIASNAGNFTATVLIGADGANSNVRRTFGGTARNVAYAVSVEIPNRMGLQHATFDYGFIDDGYAWAFPRGEVLNVGVYSVTRKVPFRERLMAYIAALGVDPLIYSPHFRGEPEPYGGCTHATRLPILLVGDAGAYCDPMSGEGIYHALASGRLAGIACRCSLRRAPLIYQALAAPMKLDSILTNIGRKVLFGKMSSCFRRFRREYMHRMLIEGYASGSNFIGSLFLGPYFVHRSLREGTMQCKFEEYPEGPWGELPWD